MDWLREEIIIWASEGTLLNTARIVVALYCAPHVCACTHMFNSSFSTNATFLTHHCLLIYFFFLLMVNSLRRKHTCNHPICYGIAKSHNKSHSIFTISSRQTHEEEKNDKCLLWFLTRVIAIVWKHFFSIVRTSSSSKYTPININDTEEKCSDFTRIYSRIQPIWWLVIPTYIQAIEQCRTKF